MRTLTTAITLALLTACSGQPAPQPTPPKAEETAKKEEAPKEEMKKEEPKAAAKVEVGKDDGGEYPEVVVESDGDQMMYKQKEITVKANTKTRIKMVNNATTPAMVHNVVIVKKGMVDAVGQAAITVPRDEEHVPAHEAVIAATKLAGPGETTTVVVDLPPGEYEFVCTFPGHYAMMKGVVKVVEG